MSLSIVAQTTSPAVAQVLNTTTYNAPLARIHEFLTPEEAARARTVNKAFNNVTHQTISLRKSIIERQQHIKALTKCYMKEQADEIYFSKPTTNYRNDGPVLTHASLAMLANLIQKKGNKKMTADNIQRAIDCRAFWLIKPDSSKKFKPTEFIKMIPNNEVEGVYLYMWKILGCPKKAHAGKDAFHDQHKMHSTPSQKARAIQLFLQDTALKFYQTQKPTG